MKRKDDEGHTQQERLLTIQGKGPCKNKMEYDFNVDENDEISDQK